MPAPVVLSVRLILTAVVCAAALAKLADHDPFVAAFAQIGLGQGMRYATGALETGAAVLLWVPRRQVLGAGLLSLTMLLAALAHLLILGASAWPAAALGALALTLLWHHRDQLVRG